MTLILMEKPEGTMTNAKLNDPIRFLGIRLTNGIRLGSKFPADTVVHIRSKAIPKDFFWTGPMVICSEKFKTVIQRFGDMAEWIPLNVTWVKGALDRQFFCMNLLHYWNCLDEEASVFLPEKGFATDIKELVLLPDLKEPPIYWIAKAIPPIMCVRDDVGEALRSFPCTGIELVEPGQWRNPMCI